MAIDTAGFFEKLFENHNAGLLRFLTRKLNSSEQAEDIAQNAFARIQSLKHLPEMENSKAYLYQVASNLVIDQKRREKLHGAYVQREFNHAQGDAMPNGESSPEENLIAQRQIEALERTLNKLPAKCRRAFLMHRSEGMSYREIALELSVTVSSVEKYILQALKHFRKTLAKEGVEEFFNQ